MEYVIENYDLKLIDKEDNTCKTELFPIQGEALQKERRKLYVVCNDTEVLYVGEANTSIKTRFQRGCISFNYFIKNGEARGGYKGYKWLNKKDNPQRNLKVIVAIFNKDYDHDNLRSSIEAIEGELVYLVRNKLGYWPKFQNEIHFSNCEGTKEIAEGILGEVFGELV